MVKIIVSLFVIFAVSRVFLRYKDGNIGILGTILWSLLWTIVGVFVWLPKFSDLLAHQIGIGRGVDALVYFSIIALFYLLFRLYVRLEFIEHELTTLVRNLALRNTEGDKSA